MRGGGWGGVGLIFLTSGNCQLPEGFGLAFIKTPCASPLSDQGVRGNLEGVDPLTLFNNIVIVAVVRVPVLQG